MHSEPPHLGVPLFIAHLLLLGLSTVPMYGYDHNVSGIWWVLTICLYGRTVRSSEAIQHGHGAQTDNIQVLHIVQSVLPVTDQAADVTL